MKFFLLALSVLLPACGSDGDPPGDTSGGVESEPETEPESECSDKDTYAPGLAKTSGDVEVSIVEAAPAPPAKGMNVMTFAVRDAAGPLDGATIRLTPFMPEHGHGSSWQPVVTSLGGGQYKIEKVQLPMAGRWSLMMEIVREGRPAENVAYSFCVSEP